LNTLSLIIDGEALLDEALDFLFKDGVIDATLVAQKWNEDEGFVFKHLIIINDQELDQLLEEIENCNSKSGI
jgi:hypothetical protein